ncbi:hypothetical protein OIU79_022635 [Salix purpurea]|uniref:Protein kinase domain-containing protein n=1 Tax=Salix purpurea TaxID=77065 RepID=A0A9Q0WG86_SALPP|nr:hypothetical protein OIU79_022635 [Salix purpurea]
MAKKNTLISFSLLLSLFAFSFAIEDDVTCLEGVKTSFTDPLGRLTSWAFNNSSVGYICKLNGVSCWNEKENRIISLQLPLYQLSGKLPESLKYCHSLTTLDLSNNDLSGPIPPEICNWLPYVVTLDLSGNKFSGPIPPEIVNCKFLNSLILSGNKLTGSIPYGFGRLDRLKRLSVAYNDLTGSIPEELGGFPKDAFDGNDGLCGKPLGKCGGLSSKSLGIIIVAGVIGAGGSLILGFVIWWWLFARGKRGGGVGGSGGKRDDSSWIGLLRSHKLVQVTLFQKPIVKIKLADILAATNSFDFENVVISTRTGLSYQADLPDGSSLAIKRLNTCKLGEKQFRGEMNRLGQLRHPNLVPLLGFCVVEVEKLLVYKHMPNGVSNAEEGFKGNLVDWVNQLVSMGRSTDAIDKALVGKGHDDDIMQFLKVAWSCVVSRPKDRPTMYQIYESLKGMAEKHGFSDQHDEFPLKFGKQDPDYK